MKSDKRPAMSDLERINRSYAFGSQSYTPSRWEDDTTHSEDQKDSTDAKQSPPPSRE